MSLSQNNLVKNYDVNGLEVQNTYLLCFCGILQRIVPNNNISGNIEIINSSLLDSYFQNSFFYKGLRLMVFALLLILLINFFIFNYYYKKSIESNAMVATNRELLDKIKQTKERLKVKESKLNNITNTYDSKNSHLINEIVKNIPTTILLNELTLHPIEKNIIEDQAINFQNDVIIISGKTINTKELTNWFEEIEKNDWVKETSIVHFGKNENGESIFTLKVKLKQNEIK